ncbi:MAG: aldose 1-epimerase [Aureliella sp.]
MKASVIGIGLWATFVLVHISDRCMGQTVTAGPELIVDKATGSEYYELAAGNTTARFSAQQGANLFSLKVAGQELLWQPESLSQIGGVSCGVPVLYPTPNRVKDAKLTFGRRTVKFPANAGKNFIHGLVNRHPWEVLETSQTADFATIRCRCSFEDGEELAARFPFPHFLEMNIELRPGRVRWTYKVDNSTGTGPVPFGFALHPYFRYLGERKETFLTIPASHLMESEDKLPTGRLLPVAKPIGEPMSLAGTKYDDVFSGMSSKRPTIIEFRDVKTRITIRASDAFTHLVVWTPDRPFVGVESQTCSTDAHNLHAAGKEQAAHLQICPVGKTMTGWVEYVVDQY